MKMKNLMAMLYIYDLAVLGEVSERIQALEKRSLDFLFGRTAELVGDY